MKTCTGLLLGTIATLVLGSGATAQQVDPLKLIDFHINAERQNVSFNGTEREGGKFTLTLHNTEQTFAISLVQRTETRFVVTVFRRRVAGNDTTFAALETVQATLGRPTALSALPYFTVVVDGTRRANARVSAAPAVQPVLASLSRSVASTFGTCCLTCGNITACGCAVKGDCGSCCADECCPK